MSCVELLAVLGRSKEKCRATRRWVNHAFRSQSPLSAARRILGRSFSWQWLGPDIPASMSAIYATRLGYLLLSRKFDSSILRHGCELQENLWSLDEVVVGW